MYTRQYKDFRGVDFSSARAECAPTRFNDLKNMWRDYHSEQGAAVETAPGFRALFGVEGEVHSMHYLTKDKEAGKLLVHAGTSLWSCPFPFVEGSEATALYTKMGEKASQSVLFHDRLYIVDGKEYICVDGDRILKHSTGAYVPTTYLDGVAYEQKNILTDAFLEKYTKPSYEDGGSYYTIHERTAGLVYYEDNGKDTVIRGGVQVTNDEGAVTKLLPFKSQLPDEGIEVLEIYEDGKWKELSRDELGPIGRYFDWHITPLGVGRYEDYEAHEEGFFLWDTEAAAGGAVTKHFFGLLTPYKTGYLFHGKDYDFVCTIDTTTYTIENITQVFLQSTEGIVEVCIGATSAPSTFQTVGDMRDMLSGNPDFPAGYSAKEAINGCTLITEFDGRVFLSGNPRLPNSVFYSQRDPTGYNNPFYIGCYNYLNDGTGKTPITAMITTPTQLIVLKDDVAQGAAIYYHYAQDNPSEDKVTADLQPRIYPRENGVPGVGCLGMACNFLDDPVFLSPKGLEAIGKSQVNLERTVTHRSSLVDARLCNENLRRAVYAEWDGYLCILVPGGRMYLADSRQISEVSGSAQYEWYYLDDIGVYAGQKNRYHYVTGSTLETIGSLQVGHKPSGLYERNYVPDDATVLTEGEGENTLGYVIEGEYAYIVESDGEQTGGVFKEATALLAVDGMLLFGCADGTVCMMNTDMRDERGFIAQDAYKHNGRGYESYCFLCSDTCGVENATKSTVSGSFVVKCKAFPATGVSVSVRTNEIEWEDVDRIVVGRVDLSRMSFLGFTFNTMRENTALVREKEKRWVEKQVAFHDYCYMSPFGLLSATYDYKIAGKVRMR